MITHTIQSQEKIQSNLSQCSVDLLKIPQIQRLKQIYNSTVSYTELFDHLTVTRYEHSVHAAAQVRDLHINLSEHEKKVLELSLLFHDIGHGPGSHALDEIIWSLNGAPNIASWGYSEKEYHEMHGAKIVGIGSSCNYIKEVLGKDLYGDLIAVLTADDARTKEQKSATYGEYSPTLTHTKIHRLAKLKDVLDRTSYLELDYNAGGYHCTLIDTALRAIHRYRQNIELTQNSICTKQEGTIDLYRQLLHIRKLHHTQISAHPINSLLTYAIKKHIWNNFNKLKCNKKDLYELIMNCALNDDWDEILPATTNYQSMINNYVSILTINYNDLTPRGQIAFSSIAEPYTGLCKSITGYPNRVITAAELMLQHRYKNTADITTLVTKDTERSESYLLKINDTIQIQNYIPIPTKTKKVVIAVDRSNNTDKIQSKIINYFFDSGWLPKNADLTNSTQFDTFLKPNSTEAFDPKIIRKMNMVREKLLDKNI